MVCDRLPTVVRSARLTSVVERAQVARAFGHYVDRLAFECALMERSKGRLVVYFERVVREDARLMVYDIEFRNLDAIRAEAMRRMALLESTENVSELPSCPAWLCRYCGDARSCTPANGF